jgi:xanthine dehydrogenase accessory factor
MVGSVGDERIDCAVQEDALSALRASNSSLHGYDVGDTRTQEGGLVADGRVSIYIEPVDYDWWVTAVAASRNHRPSATATIVAGDSVGHKLLVEKDAGVTYHSPGLAPSHYRSLVRAAEQALDGRNKTRCVTIDGSSVFVDTHMPPPRLIIIGSSYAAQVLCKVAVSLGYEVIVIDPHCTLARVEHFPHVSHFSYLDPERILPELGLDRSTYVAIMSGEPEVVEPALLIALASPVAYVGMVGGMCLHQQCVERLQEAGADLAMVQQIHTPTAQISGVLTPEELALSIMTEITAINKGANRIEEPVVAAW